MLLILMSIVAAELNSSSPPQFSLHIVFGNIDYHAQFEANYKTAQLHRRIVKQVIGFSYI